MFTKIQQEKKWKPMGKMNGRERTHKNILPQNW
jgi:hypothetical protein